MAPRPVITTLLSSINITYGRVVDAIVAARQAVADAGLDAEGADIDKNRIGVIVAAGIGGLHTFTTP